jgi:uncharacterized protein with ParB-like and HNH nuclease domain
MKTTQPIITIRDLVKGYKDSGENGVVAYGGRLNVRPAYQRAFVYDPEDRDKVIQSVYNQMPLNSIYWAINLDGSYEVIDGQQRLISICQFVTNDDGNGNPIAIDFNGKNTQTFEGLSAEKQQEILDYKLQVYICEGTADEKLDWFHTINIAGKRMTDQELLNANNTGLWLTEAKRFFSKKSNNEAIAISYYDNDDKKTLLTLSADRVFGDMGGLGDKANRQLLLELALRWRIDADPNEYPQIKDYMAKHRLDENADELISYFKSVISWVKNTFTIYRTDMKGQEWGALYNTYHQQTFQADKIEKTLKELYDLYAVEPDGLKKQGFYEYALCGDRTLIWHRAFSERQQKQAYENQGRKCARCHQPFPMKELEGHHKVLFANGGSTTIDNCIMLCKNCHEDLHAESKE